MTATKERDSRFAKTLNCALLAHRDDVELILVSRARAAECLAGGMIEFLGNALGVAYID